MSLNLPRSQKGAALLLFFFGLIMASATVFIVGLSNRNPQRQEEIRVRRELQQAKAELLAFAALYSDYNSGKGPGRFPCPDTNNDGVMDCNTSVSLGRLPINIGRADNDIDQQFWLAVAPAYQHKAIDTPINTSTDGVLRLDGNEVVALLLAPGPTVASQTRLSVANRMTVANYLEGGNATAPNFVTLNAALGLNYNDRVLSIRRNELMTVVTPRVAQEIKRVLDAAPPYPATQAAFNAMMTASTATWFNVNNWLAQVTYTSASPTQALVTFSSCNIVFQITAGATRLVRHSSGESRC